MLGLGIFSSCIIVHRFMTTEKEILIVGDNEKSKERKKSPLYTRTGDKGFSSVSWYQYTRIEIFINFALSSYTMVNAAPKMIWSFTHLGTKTNLMPV